MTAGKRKPSTSWFSAFKRGTCHGATSPQLWLWRSFATILLACPLGAEFFAVFRGCRRASSASTRAICLIPGNTPGCFLGSSRVTKLCHFAKFVFRMVVLSAATVSVVFEITTSMCVAEAGIGAPSLPSSRSLSFSTRTT